LGSSATEKNIPFMDFVYFSQQTLIIFVNSSGRLITSIESNIL